MASILNYGAGAGEGLQTLLENMLAEHSQSQRDKQLEEQIRSNKETEKYRTDSLKETAAQRMSTQRSLDDNRRRQDEDRDNTRVLGQMDLLPIGSKIQPDDKSKFLKAGASEANFDWKPANMGMSTPEGEVGPTDDQTTWKGTASAINAAKDKQAAGMHPDTKIYQGKPTDVLVDTRAGKVFLPQEGGNVEVTGQTQHYEKPPAPDRVLIQTGEGYDTRKNATKKINDGKDVPLPTTSSTRTMQEGAKMLQPHIDDLKEQAQGLEAAGMFGPVMSRIRHLAERVGTIDALGDAIAADPELSKDRRIGKFATSLGLLATGAGRVHGGARGGGSPQMLEHFKHLLNDSSTVEMFLGRLDAVDDYMETYAKGTTTAPVKQDDKDPLGILKR